MTTQQQSYKHYQISKFRHQCRTTRSQTSVSRLWYDLSSEPVLIMADAMDDILSALQQLYLINSQVIHDLEQLSGKYGHTIASWHR